MLDRSLDTLEAELVVPLRARLTENLEASGDATEATSLVRATYREWKGRIDEIGETSCAPRTAGRRTRCWRRARRCAGYWTRPAPAVPTPRTTSWPARFPPASPSPPVIATPRPTVGADASS